MNFKTNVYKYLSFNFFNYIWINIQKVFKKPVEKTTTGFENDFKKYDEIFLDIMVWAKLNREVDFSTVILKHYGEANTFNTFDIVMMHWSKLIEEKRFELGQSPIRDLLRSPLDAYYMYNIYSKDRHNLTDKEVLENFYKDLTTRMLSHFTTSRVDWFIPLKDYKIKIENQNKQEKNNA